MTSGRMRLDWKQFSETAEKAFKDAALSGDFSDVTLAGDDGQFVEAHRLVLSSASTVLRMILLKIPYKNHPFLYMKGMNIKDISLLLKFVYTGEVTLEKESLDNFLENANELQIAGLVKTARGNIAESCFPPIEGEIKSDFLETDGTDTKVKLKTHIRAMHDGIAHACTFCSYETSFPSNLKRHIQKVHEENQSFNKNTSEEAANQRQLNETAEQMENYTSQEEKERKTVMDNQIFESRIEFPEEPVFSSENQKELKSFPCGQCGKGFASKNTLYIHRKSIHELVKYPCDDCDLQATTKSNLNAHRRNKHAN